MSQTLTSQDSSEYPFPSLFKSLSENEVYNYWQISIHNSTNPSKLVLPYYRLASISRPRMDDICLNTMRLAADGSAYGTLGREDAPFFHKSGEEIIQKLLSVPFIDRRNVYLFSDTSCNKSTTISLDTLVDTFHLSKRNAVNMQELMCTLPVNGVYLKEYYPRESLSTPFSALFVTVTLLCSIIIGLRLYSRSSIFKLLATDWTILIGYVRWSERIILGI